MKSRLFLVSLLGAISAILIAGCNTDCKGKCSTKKEAPEAVAIYYPHWHPYPIGEKYKGKGWTEYEDMKTAKPMFKGHKQPKIPTMGYLRSDNPDDVAKEIDLAADAGISAFLYCWYWYSGSQSMQEGIEKGLLKAKNKDRIKFAIMWANHDRVDAFRPKYGGERPLWNKIIHTEEDMINVANYCAEKYFNQPNYWRINGKSYFAIYRPIFTIEQLGGAAKTKAILKKIDAMMKEKGLPAIHWAAQVSSTKEAKIAKEAGFESTFAYGVNVYSAYRNWELGTPIVEYSDLMQAHCKHWDAMSKGEIVNLPGVTRGWDSTPRCRQDTPFPFPKKMDYPYTSTVVNGSAELYKELLQKAKNFAKNDSKKPFAVILNAWNEWTEGGYLLPDKYDGRTTLDAIGDVFGGK